MLRLEDYIDKLEHLPQDIRNNFTELREMDLQVEHLMSCVDKKVNDLFSNADHMNPDDLKSNFDEIMIEGEKSVQQCEEKVQLANSMHTLMSNYLKELDQDINKCRMELEANNNGICEIIEKRSLDSGPMSTTNRKEKKKRLNRCLFENNEKILKRDCSSIEKSTPNTSSYTINENFVSSQCNINSSMCQMNPPSFTQTMDNSIEIDNTIIVATTSQDGINTKEISQDDETAELKVPLDILNSKIEFKDKISTNPTQSPLEIPTSETLVDAVYIGNIDTNETKKQKKERKLENLAMSTEEDDKINEKNDVTEPRYCVCNQVAFGVMVACDSKKCLHEWFHCECVGISDPPKGKWYCPRCLKNMKRRRARRN